MTVFVRDCGMITPVGLTAEAAAAAMRAKVMNTTETIFYTVDGLPIFAGQIPLEPQSHADSRLSALIDAALYEALDASDLEPGNVALFLCLPDPEELNLIVREREAFLEQINWRYGSAFAKLYVVERAEVGAVQALGVADKILGEDGVDAVIALGVDSFLSPYRLNRYEEEERILTEAGGDGFIPGEAAAALVLTRSAPGDDALRVDFVREAVEPGHRDSEDPNRADGLAACLKEITASDPDFFLTCSDVFLGVTGEQTFFREASLALARSVRNKPDNFDIHHSAQSTGRAGAATFPTDVAYCLTRARRMNLPPTSYLFMVFSDGEQRGAAHLRWLGAQNGQ